MIEARGLTKKYGDKVAVDNVSFTIAEGQVTGFLGPNGAGKSTTMRMMVGLDRPTSGTVTINGKSYREHTSPLREVGALLEARSAHAGRSAENHLLALAATHGIGKARVHEVIAMAGLESVARKRVGGFSLGMGQRLGIAVALLGNPKTVVLDEPVNGLDPDGVRWVRSLLRHLASEGRTVLLSSHLMSEMAQTADHIIVLGRGKVIADAPVSDILSMTTQSVRVRSPHASELAQLLVGPDVTTKTADDGALIVSGLTSEHVGNVAAEGRFVLHELTPLSGSLEDAYLSLTDDQVEYRTGSEPTNKEYVR